MPDLKLLGGVVLESSEGPLSGPAARRHPLAILALLATAASRSMRRPKLIGLVWPEVDESTGRNRLTTALYHLRQALGSSALVSAGDDLRLDTDALGCDVWRFEAAVDGGDLHAAVRAYGGPFLDGFYLEHTPEFTRWADVERDRLRRRYLDALDTLARDAEREGRSDAAARWWRERAGADPYDTKAIAHLLRALKESGNRAEALRVAEAHVARLEEDFETRPDPEFESLMASLRRPGRERAPTDRAIAVLPLETSGAAGGTALGEGIHAGILARLADIAGLHVIARTSVRRYRGGEQPASEIGRELGVAWILEGEVQEHPPHLRVDVRLVDASTDRQVWAATYVEALSPGTLFDIQAEITKKIVGSLELELTPAEQRRIERHPTGSLEAYRLYAQARMHVERRTEDDMWRAVDGFERVVELDPGYALAWVGLADALGLLHAYGYLEPERALRRAEEAIRHALDVDPGSAEAHAALGRLLGQKNDAAAAERAIERAIELKPGYAEAHNWRTVGCHVAGRRGAALESARRAVELNPLSPEAVFNLGLSYLIVGEHANALAEARRTRELVPSYVSGAFLEGVTLYEMARFDEAAGVLRGLSVPWAGSGPSAVRALALRASGDEEEAEQILRCIEAEGDGFAAGLVHAARGDIDRAFAGFLSLDCTSVEHRESYWPTIAIRYLFREVWDVVRDDPRYEELWRRMERSWGLEGGGTNQI